MTPFTAFTSRTVAFLRRLQRNNRREWFHEHRETYERDVRGPMIALVERLAADLPSFAPDLVASPRLSIYRIYRDTRFSPDKSPLKTHIAAVFPHRDLGKHEGAGLYLHVSPSEVLVAGGLYAPTPTGLQALRQHIASHHRGLRTVVESPAFRRAAGAVTGQALQRVPRGFPADHPAAQYLKLRQFLAGREHPPEFATRPQFYRHVLTTFRALAPFVHFLNEPLVRHRRQTAHPLETSGPRDSIQRGGR
jgi:uncharacterized protein (TIGR02453 family)